MYVLVIHDPSGEARRRGNDQVLLSHRKQTIGSAEGNSIVLRGDGIAPRHCVVERITDGYKLVDLQTEQGTLVNGSYIAQKKLEPGDRIELSGCELIFERRAPPAAPPVRPDVLGGGESGDQGPPHVRRRRSSGGLQAARTALYTVTVLLLIAGISSVLPGLLGREEGATHGKDRLKLAGVYEQMGYFSRAENVLLELEEEREGDSGVGGEQIASALDRLGRVSFRQRLGREELAALVGDERLTAGEKLEQARRLYDLFDDLPCVSEEIQECIDELVPVVRQATRQEVVSLIDLAHMCDSMLANRNFSGARNVWIDLRGSSLASDGELLEAAIALVDVAAGVEAQELLRRVDTMLARDDLMGAAIILDNTDLVAYRGTSAYAAVNAKVSELEALVNELKPADMLAGALPLEKIRSGRRRSLRSLAAPERDPDPPPGETRPERPAPARSSVAEIQQAIEEGDELFLEGHLRLAIASYERWLGGELSHEERNRLTRRIERARRAGQFLESLYNFIEADPARVAGLVVADRTGKRGGIIREVRDGEFQVESEQDRFSLRPEQLRSSSVLALARRFRLAAEDLLDLIFYRMTDGIPEGGRVAKEFHGLIQDFLKAGHSEESDGRRSALHSAVAFLRGFPEVPDGGFFEHEGLWLSFEEREQARTRTAIRAAVARLDRNGDKTYAAGLEELKSLIPVAGAEVAEVLTVRRARMLKELSLQPEFGAIGRLIATRRELGRRRAHALKLIFDRDKYFYPYKLPDCPPEKAKLYPGVQQEVDRRVDLVREIWGQESKPKGGGVQISRRFHRVLTQLRAEQELLMPGDLGGFREEALFQRLKLLPSGTGRMTVRQIALDPEERRRLDRDEEVLATNARGPWVAKKQEREQVLITNQYRLMMGRSAVQIHDALVRSSRQHCEWLTGKSGRVSHVNYEDSRLRTPHLRMAAQGYTGGGSGENIAVIGGALAAHKFWLLSSGHHRNILFASHRDLGSGNYGAFWCQNFAGGQEYAGNLPEDL